MTTALDLPAELEQIRAAMRASDVRVEFSETWSLSEGVVPTARIFLRGATPRSKWRQVGPLLLPPKGGSRSDLLDMLHRLATEDDGRG